MTDDIPGALAVRAQGATTPPRKAKTKQPPKSPSPKTRTVGKRQCRSQMPADIGYEDDGMEPGLHAGDAVLPAEGLDPAMVAARRMVVRAVRESHAGKKVRARGGLVVVAVPGPEWLDLVEAQWKALFRGGFEPGDGEVELRRQRSSRTWIVFSRDGTDRAHVPGRGNDVVADAAWKGRAVVGFSAAPDTQLPAQLTRLPDCRVSIPPLTAELLRGVIRDITGKAPVEVIPESVATAMTPEVLRLARQPRQSADAYLSRLVTLAGKTVPAGRPGPDLDGVHGMDEAVAWGQRWIRDLGEYRAGRIPWTAMDSAALLHGAPGTGKTMFAEALAKSAGVPLISASFARWQASGNGYLGDCLKAMRATFDEARRRAPCVLLIDEMDAIGSRAADKGEHGDYWTAVITAALELLDGTERLEAVLVLGTTNDPDAIDPALLRSGRMDRMLEIRRPDPAALEGILRHHLGPDLVDADVAPAVRLALGGSGADCARWVRTARQAARQAGRLMVPADLIAAIGATSSRPDIDRMVAVHEAGHAVATAVLRPGAVTDARINPGAGLSGAVRALPDRRSTREAIHGALLELLAGRAAEEVLLGDFSGGSGGSTSSDLAMATCHAVAVETALGLGSFGPMWQGLPTPDTVVTLLALRPALAARVQANLESAYVEAVGLVRSYRDATSAVADALVKMRSITGSEIEGLVAAHRPDGTGAAP